MKDGQMIEYSKTYDAIKNPKHDYTKELIGPSNNFEKYYDN